MGGQLSFLAPVLGLVLRRVDRASSAGVIKAYVAAGHGDDDIARQEVLAKVMMATGLGFSLGSSLGGWLSVYGANTVASAASAIALGAALIAAQVLEPESTAQQPPVQQASCMAGGEGVWRSVGQPGVTGLLAVRFIVGVAFFFITSTFDLYCRERFGFTPAQFGYFLSYIGLCFSMVSGLVVPPLVARYPSRFLFMAGLCIMALARLGLGLARTVPQVLLADFFVALGSSVVGTTGSSLLAEVGPAQETGLRMGLSESAQSLAGVATPALAGYLYEQYGNSAPGFSAAAFCMVALALFSVSVHKGLGLAMRSNGLKGDKAKRA